MDLCDAGSQTTNGVQIPSQRYKGFTDADLVGVVVAALVVFFCLIVLVGLYLYRRTLALRRSQAIREGEKSSGSSPGSTPWGTDPYGRRSLVFPPLEAAEGGIDLDMENLFKTAGPNSDNSQDGLELRQLDSNGAVELPQVRLCGAPHTSLIIPKCYLHA